MRFGAIGVIAASCISWGCGSSGSDSSEKPETGHSEIVGTVTLAMDEKVIDPGGEKYFCQTFGNPFGDKDVLASAFASTLGRGAHHMLLFYSPLIDSKPGPLEECGSFEFAPTAFGSQLPHERLEFPPGVAVVLPANTRLRVQVHYVNTTDLPITVRSQVEIDLTSRDDVEQLAGNFFVNPADGILVPARSQATVTRRCPLPFDVNVFAALSHMHRFGVGFDSTLGGNALITRRGGPAESETEAYTPPRFGAKGSEVLATCHYENPESFDVVGGGSFTTQEMCILSAYYFPVPDGVAGTIAACDPNALWNEQTL